MSFTYSPYDMSSEQLEHLTYEKSSPSSAILSHFGHFIFTSYMMTARPIISSQRIREMSSLTNEMMYGVIKYDFLNGSFLNMVFVEEP